MDRRVLAVAGYRFRSSFRRRLGGLVAIVLLVGLVGGLAMAAVAGARRTQSSYPAFLASTDPSDLTVSVFLPGGTPGPSLVRQMAALPKVAKVSTIEALTAAPLTPSGAPDLRNLGSVLFVSSLSGELFHQDRVAVLQGRMVDPRRPDEVDVTASAARLLGVHLGEVLPVGLYSAAQKDSPGFGTAAVAPRRRIGARVVGIVTLDNDIVQDDVDRAYGFVLATPALEKEAIALSGTGVMPSSYDLQLVGGGSGVPAVEREISDIIPRDLTYNFHVTARTVSEVELSVKPESVALGAFGAIAGLVCLVVAVQAVARQLRADDEERRVLRSLGVGPLAAAADGLAGVLLAVVAGAVVAVVVAVGLSPLAPLGPVRPVYPSPGVAFDWTVLGAGLAVLIGVLGTAAAVIAYRSAPHRAIGGRQAVVRGSAVARGASAAGFPVAGEVGIRMALEPGRGRTAVPVRSALTGTVLAVSLVVATLTFASGLTTLVSHPSLYGWNWSYVLNPSNEVPPVARTLLDHDPDVAAWSGYDYDNAQIDGQNVPILLARAGTAVTPPVITGRPVRARDQIVLGAATMAALHAHVGGTVTLSYGSPKDAPVYIPSTRLTVVGTATFPAIGFASFVADHTSMGTGAQVSTAILPASFQRAVASPDPTLDGPDLALVRMKPTVSPSAGRADMQRIARAANQAFAADPDAAGNDVTVLGVQRPAQIVNYRSIGATPVLLAVGLAAGAIVALGVTLVVSVRRRRRDLALLKVLGLTPGQLASAVAWQSTVTAVIGVIVGVPLGIVVGRQLWTQFANNINAVPDPTVPALAVVLVAVGALVFANLVAALPGRTAARTPAALALRAE